MRSVVASGVGKVARGDGAGDVRVRGAEEEEKAKRPAGLGLRWAGAGGGREERKKKGAGFGLLPFFFLCNFSVFHRNFRREKERNKIKGQTLFYHKKIFCQHIICKLI